MLARGLGTRMRKANSSAELERDQAAAAATGLKAMIPVGRPFLDYVLSAVADAGFDAVCLVIGPEHQRVREYYEREARVSRLQLSFAVQEQPLGTADAVLAARTFAGSETFVVLNSDNYYPRAALAVLHTGVAPAIAGFSRQCLIERGNVPADRVLRFGALELDAEGYLVRIVGDPERARASTGGETYASMNCWLFTDSIFEACAKVEVSARGELELTRAVQLAIDTGLMRFQVHLLDEPVLDLSSRLDIASVTRQLKGTLVRL